MSYHGLGAVSGICPQGYSYENNECVPNWWDCKTPSGDYGKENPQGGCDYIVKPIPNITGQPSGGTTTVPTQGTVPVATGCPPGQKVDPFGSGGCVPESYVMPCMTPAGPGVIDMSGSCFFSGADTPCKGPSGEKGIWSGKGTCIYTPAPQQTQVQPYIPPQVQPYVPPQVTPVSPKVPQVTPVPVVPAIPVAQAGASLKPILYVGLAVAGVFALGSLVVALRD